jgi:hypothetical protein
MQKILPLASDIPEEVNRYFCGSHATIRQGLHLLPVPTNFLRGLDGKRFITPVDQVIYTFNRPSLISGDKHYTPPLQVKKLVDRINKGGLFVECNMQKTLRMQAQDNVEAIAGCLSTTSLEHATYYISGPAQAWVNDDNTISLGATVRCLATPFAENYFEAIQASNTDVILGILFTHVKNRHDTITKVIELMGFCSHPLVSQDKYGIMPDDANEYEILPIPSYQQPIVYKDVPRDPWPASVFNNKFVNGILTDSNKPFETQPTFAALKDFAEFRLSTDLTFTGVKQLLGEDVAGDLARLLVANNYFKEVLFRSEYILIGSIRLFSLITFLTKRAEWFMGPYAPSKAVDYPHLFKFLLSEDDRATYLGVTADLKPEPVDLTQMGAAYEVKEASDADKE